MTYSITSYATLRSVPTNVPLTYLGLLSVDTLNKRLRLKLTKHDINYTYSFQDRKTSRFYFKIRQKEVRLISSLPNFDKEREEDYLIILGNWYPDGIHYPQVRVKQVGRFYRIFFLLTY